MAKNREHGDRGPACANGGPAIQGPSRPPVVIGRHVYIAAWAAVVTVVINMIALVVTSVISSESLRSLKVQLELQAERASQQRPVDFRVATSRDDGGNLTCRVENLGSADVINIDASLKFYFAFSDGRIASLRGIERILTEDPSLLEAFRNRGLLVRPTHVHRLVKTGRRLKISRLEGALGGDVTDLFEPEVSPSSVLNALRIAELVNGRVVMAWRFDYQHFHSRDRHSLYSYTLVTEAAAPPLPKRFELMTRDLRATTGGGLLIDAIVQHEHSSMDDLFPDEK